MQGQQSYCNHVPDTREGTPDSTDTYPASSPRGAKMAFPLNELLACCYGKETSV